jgi:tetratricopeptide (TPR) repeat protein
MNQTAIPEVNYKDDTIESLQKEVASAREKNDTHNLISLLKKLGLAFIENGDAPQALSEFDEALKLVATGDDKESFAQFLGLRGLALKLLGNFSLAMQAFRKSNKVAIEIKHPALTVDSLIQIAGLYTDLEKPENALTNLDSALRIAIEQKDKVRKMRVNGLMGDHFSRQADPGKAKQYFQAAYETALDLENHGAECSFITKLGNAFLLEGNTESAIEKYERALKLASALDDRNAEINILGGLFRAHALDKNVQLASIYGEKVITLAREFKHAEAEISNIVAFTSFLADNGKVPDTIPYLVRGAQIADDQNRLDLKLDMLVRLGLASYQEGHYDLALEHFNTAFVIASNVSDELTQLHVASYIASVYADMEQYENSITVATKALILAEKLEDLRLIAEQQILLAFNYRDCHQSMEAVRYCSAALESFKKLDDSAMVEQAQVLLESLEPTNP